MSQARVAEDRNSSPDSFEIVSISNGRFEIRGPLTFATARRASEGLRSLRISSDRELQVDCSGITASDSAGLAVLLEWLAVAKRAGHSLRFTNLPSGLVTLARISNVDQLL